MNREFKFRAWCKNHKVMVEKIDFVKWNEKRELFVNQDHRCAGKEILMQYTGLKDKNNVEIYEGDILSPTDKWNESKYIIEWNEINCCFTSIDGGAYNFCGDPDDEIKYNLLSNMRLDLVEIIGNVYENSDLFNYTI